MSGLQMSSLLPVIVLLPQVSFVCGTALPLGDWQQAVSESGQAATLNTHNGGYDLEIVDHCMHDKYSDIVAKDSDDWVSIDEWKEFGLGLDRVPSIPVDMDNVDRKRWDSPVVDLTVNEGGVEKQIKATVGFGHGVASLKCGDCFLLETSGTNIPEDSWIHNIPEYNDLLAYDKLTRYAVIRTVDIATSSLEISDPSLYYLLPMDGRIDHSTQPKYQSVDCKAVMSAVVTGAYELHKGPGSDHCAETGMITESSSSGRDDCESRCTADPACKFISLWASGGANWCRLNSACDVLGQQSWHTINIYQKAPSPYELHSGPGSDYCAETGMISESSSSGKDDCESRCTADPACKFISLWTSGGANWCRLNSACDVLSQQSWHTISIYLKATAPSAKGSERRLRR